MPERTLVVSFAGERRKVASGTTVAQFLAQVYGEDRHDILAALVNRRLVMLDFPLRGRQVDLEAVGASSREGEAVARRTASLILLEAMRELYPEARLVVGQSLGGGYFFSWHAPVELTPAIVASIGRRMEEICNEDRAFQRWVTTWEEAEALFRAAGEISKLELLATYRSSTVPLVSCGQLTDIAHGAVAPSTGRVRGYALVPYEDGLLLRFPRNGDRSRLQPLAPQPRLFSIYRETRRWNEVLGVAHVGSLNRLCLTGEIADVIRIAEGFQEKKIAQIADAIAARRGGVRVVLVAGPSASGKTTFIRRLGIQLRVNGISPVGLSLDNYFVDRAQTPIGADGNPDYEALEALDLELLNAHLAALLAGEVVEVPRYDFLLGRRSARDRFMTLRLGREEILLVEGIHALNPRLTGAVPEEAKFRLFISALTQLTLDDHNRIFTSDSRLLRRIVRDRLARGHAATRTLEMWGAVRRGEARGIFPFQEKADAIFNSALVYEPAVLKVYAERFLLEVPREHATYTEAYRLLKFLSWFVPVFQDDVPQTSILREFIGGSAFDC
ncbi:MAG: nucleoside kinase [Acidobacteriota bacterium]